MLENILVVYLVFVNIAAFGMYGIDKQKAIRKQWRIPEAQLLAVAAIGGSAGALLGMQFFHQKMEIPSGCAVNSGSAVDTVESLAVDGG